MRPDPVAAPLDWYELLAEIARRPGVVNLATGSPIVSPALDRLWSRALPALGRDATNALGRYGPALGEAPLREAFAAACATAFGRPVGTDEVCVVAGAQGALTALQRLLGRRGAVALAETEFPGAWNALHRERIRPIPIEWEDTGPIRRPRLACADVTAADIGCAILSRPHSPLGWAWSEADLTALSDRVHAAGGILVLDETYALPLAPLSHTPPAPFDAPAVVHVYSFSKVGLAGERIGLAVGPSDVIAELHDIVERATIRVAHTSQALATALVEGLQEDHSLGAAITAPYKERWERLRTGLEGSGVLRERAWLSEWSGAPFGWCGWTGSPSGVEVGASLLDEGIAIAPDGVFRTAQRPHGWSGIRIGFSAGIEAFDAAIARIADHLAVKLGSGSGDASSDGTRC